MGGRFCWGESVLRCAPCPWPAPVFLRPGPGGSRDAQRPRSGARGALARLPGRGRWRPTGRGAAGGLGCARVCFPPLFSCLRPGGGGRWHAVRVRQVVHIHTGTGLLPNVLLSGNASSGTGKPRRTVMLPRPRHATRKLPRKPKRSSGEWPSWRACCDPHSSGTPASALTRCESPRPFHR